MTLRANEGGTKDLAPGDEIPEFEDFSPWTRHAMLDEKRVRWAPEGLTAHELKRARPLHPDAPKKPGHSKPWRPSPEAQQLMAAQAEPGPDAARLADQTFTPNPEMRTALIEAAANLPADPAIIDAHAGDLEQAVRGKTAAEIGAPVQAGELRCEVCNRIGFKDANGLKIHKTRAHKAV